MHKALVSVLRPAKQTIPIKQPNKTTDIRTEMQAQTVVMVFGID